MVVTVGSMAVLAVYKDGGLKSGLAGMKASVKDASNYVKSLQIDFKRMESITKKLATTAALMGASLLTALTAAVLTSPFLAGALLKIRTYMRLLGMEITKVLRPALEWLGDVIKRAYQWFKGLNPHTQKLISWFIILSSVTLAFVGVLVSLGVTLKALGFVWLITKLKALGVLLLKGVTWIAKFVGPAGLGLLIGALGVFALDKLGILNWFSKLGERFRANREAGGFFTNVITGLYGAFGLLGSAIMTLVGAKSWKDLKRDFNTWKKSLGVVLDRLKSIANILPGVNFETQGTSNPGYAIGTAIIPADGMYRLHAGEQVISNDNNSGGSSQSSSIMVSFEGAIINLASNLDIRNLAKEVSREIAETAAWGSY